MIVIIDYGLGNLRSIRHKLQINNIDSEVSSSPKKIEQARKLILPGVGHFGKGMSNLRNLGLIEILTEKVLKEKTPIFGICLGVQLFSKHSTEGNCSGLGWIDANVKKFEFDKTLGLSVPHVGWNSAEVAKQHPLLENLSASQKFYFTHSYHLVCNEDIALMKTSYGYDFVSAIGKENIFGTQFHPEKSHRAGFQLLIDFCEV